jgi:hypothetical protein
VTEASRLSTNVREEEIATKNRPQFSASGSKFELDLEPIAIAIRGSLAYNGFLLSFITPATVRSSSLSTIGGFNIHCLKIVHG